MSSAMSDWSKILNPKKLNLGISSDIIVELTVPVKDSLSINGTVPRDVNATIPSNVFVPYNDSAKDSYLKTYTDRCTFKENYSLGMVLARQAVVTGLAYLMSVIMPHFFIHFTILR